ncbi:hypothetical protein GCM10025865_06870 [Paraoerskovia sediminicola]|uniref:LUD domain-containing protein n=1 Tax=Paraoerskovia sediminicola TaxID=1138587 RepID=A0ABN6XAZ3_9CELL|nr:lactate utilization protein C [Paraoerskovia sediminicola]BDZ41388.1 hypothetical protein GCM10025865_06870 [Paraoerskovia sediminicola]
MSARDEVLTRVRAALQESDGAAAPELRGAMSAQAPVPRDYRAAGEDPPGSAAVIDLLDERVADYRAEVHRVAPHEIGTTVARILEGSSAVVVPSGLDAGWTSELAASGTALLTDSREAPLDVQTLDGADGVVTAARVAIAETGTIVLDGEPDQGRRAISLVPDLHVCVVRHDQAVQTVPEAVRLLAEHPERPQTWISGPSATSDIELVRVEGVHGPRTLHVLLVG